MMIARSKIAIEHKYEICSNWVIYYIDSNGILSLMKGRTKRPISNRTKVLIILAITGWLRVLFVLVPIGWVYFNNVSGSDTEYIKK